MEFEFDKEINSLLRQAARGETAFAAKNPKSEIQNPKSPHLDADEISAFAENALPEKAKQLYTAHFADCDRCRKILADVILLNAEAISENVHAPETVKVETVVLPWYRRLFAALNPVYAMGALVLIFGGLIAFTFLKSASRDAEVSQLNEMPMTAANTNSGGEMPAQTEANAAMTNSASMMSNTAMSNSAPVSASNASTKSVASNANAATASNNQTIAENQSAKETARTEQPVASGSAAGIPAAPPPPPAKAKPTENQINSGGAAADNNLAARNSKDKDEKRAAEADEIITTQSDAPTSTKSAAETSSLMKARSANATRAKKSQKTDAEKGETRAVGGKTFKRENGVWYDAAYGGQGTINITRGSEDFKKLDAGLRSIADAFSGTIVVVWKGKAYRIQ